MNSTRSKSERPTTSVPGLALVIITLAGIAGCAGKVKPDDLSASGHRQEAAIERFKAVDETRQYDPKAVATHNIHSPSGAAAGGDVDVDYNPTEGHLGAAKELTAHARQHELAAAQLDAFEATECAQFSKGSRTACPMMGPIVKTQEIHDGVRLDFATSANADKVVARMRCHLAYARTRGFTADIDCPLYIKGVQIRRSADGNAVEILGSDHAVVEQLRRLTKEVVHVSEGAAQPPT